MFIRLNETDEKTREQVVNKTFESTPHCVAPLSRSLSAGAGARVCSVRGLGADAKEL